MHLLVFFSIKFPTCVRDRDRDSNPMWEFGSKNKNWINFSCALHLLHLNCFKRASRCRKYGQDVNMDM